MLAGGALVTGAFPASAELRINDPCSVERQTVLSNGEVLICASDGSGRLVWRHFDKQTPGGVGVSAGAGATAGVGVPIRAQAPKKCRVLGQSRTVPGLTLICTSKGKTLVWVPSLDGHNGNPNGGSQPGNGGAQTPAREAPPVFQNLGVVFGPWDRATNHAGDFFFTQGQSSAKGAVSEFADTIATGTGTKLTSEIGRDFLAPNTPVRAVADGVVTATPFQADSNDYEVWEQTIVGSQWTIIYDHVKDLKVAQGTRVMASVQIGVAGGSTPFFELQVVQRTNDVNHQWCPTKFIDPRLRDVTFAAILQLESDWEDFKGDRTIYNPSHDAITGCLLESYVGG